jgi:hypothetical protein
MWTLSLCTESRTQIVSRCLSTMDCYFTHYLLDHHYLRFRPHQTRLMISTRQCRSNFTRISIGRKRAFFIYARATAVEPEHNPERQSPILTCFQTYKCILLLLRSLVPWNQDRRIAPVSLNLWDCRQPSRPKLTFILQCRNPCSAWRNELAKLLVSGALLVVIVKVFSRLEGRNSDQSVSLGSFFGCVRDSGGLVRHDVWCSILFDDLAVRFLPKYTKTRPSNFRAH